jgi:predicted anti-sigma-YlaC factor YlaD
MKHQPYETWIIDTPKLDPEQLRLLKTHLEGCPDCRKLSERWSQVAAELAQPTMQGPRVGFSRRWKAGLADRRLREQRRQAWKFFLACSGTAAAMFVVLVTYLAVSTTPVQWIQAGVKAVSSSAGVVTTLRDVSSTWAQLVPPVVNVAFWFSLVVTVCLLIFVWVFALWRTSLGGTIQR